MICHLIRHGQAYNTHRSLSDPYPPNPSLTPIGVRESRYLAERMRRLPLTRLISSPMARTIETARMIAVESVLPVETLHCCHEFRQEPGYVSWGADDLKRRYPDIAIGADTDRAGWYYGNETVEKAVARAGRFVTWMREQQAREPTAVIAIVTHGAITRLALSVALGTDVTATQSFVIDNTAVTTLRVLEPELAVRPAASHAPRGFLVLGLNDTSHLAGMADIDPLREVTR